MRILSFLFLLTIWALPAFAHQTGESTYVAHIRVEEGIVDTLVAFPGRDAAHHLGLDTNSDEFISVTEMEAGFAVVTTYVDGHLDVSNGGTPCAAVERKASPPGTSADAFWYMKSFKCPAPLGTLTFRNTILLESRGSYSHLGRIQMGERIDATVFNTQFPTFELKVGDDAPDLAQLIPRYIWEGVVHIVAGPDHVLFVLLLVLITLGVRRMLAVVTSFTIAHSITLVLAALNIVDVPAEVIEPLIALSIAYIAVETMVRKEPSRYLLVYTFVFGLIHGFGFSYVLRDNVGLPSHALVPALAAFNVGVELGQVAIVLLLFPVRRWVASKPWETRAVRAVAVTALVIAVFWFVERVLGALIG